MEQNIIHKPVMVEHVLNFLQPKDKGIYVDATLGCGGYTEKLFNICPNCYVIGIDCDNDAIEYCKYRLKKFIDTKQLVVIKQNFVNIKQILNDLKIEKIDGVMLDLGLSMLQIKSTRGFSFNDSSLDMRMDTTSNILTATDVINTFSEEKLAEIFKTYGEERYSKLIARQIVKYRKERQITSAQQLTEIILNVLKPKLRRIYLKKFNRDVYIKINPATKVFQALRIYVNNELDNLEKGLQNFIDVLSPNGRIIVVSYHSLEDRIVKTIFKTRIDIKVLTKKPLRPQEDEIKNNISARSAKLRAAEKI